MNLLRTALALASILLLTVGYAASQFFALNGRAAEYVALVDKSSLAPVSLLILLAAIVLAFVPDREANDR